MVNKITYIALLLVLSTAHASQARQSDADEDASPLDQVVPVAAEDVGAATGQEEIASEERLLQEFAKYRRLLSEDSLDEADVTAKRIVEMAIKIYGPQSRETASALNNLGIVQHSNEQFDAAIQNFSSAVEIIEIAEDRLNSALVNPLKGLGAAQLGIGRPDEATKTFNRAAHITHVNEGPHNLDQVEILESMAESQLRMGDTKEARNILDRIHGLNVRHFEQDPLGLLPSLMNRATWQHRAGYYNDERISYRRAIRIVEAGAGKNDPLLIEPLRRLGESFYFVDLTSSTAQQQSFLLSSETYFKRAVRIAERFEGLDWNVLIKTKLALADYYTFIDAQNRARRIYREVWVYLSSDDERLTARSELLDQPVPLRPDNLPTYAGRQGGNGPRQNVLLKGKIIVDYSVSSRGRVRNLKTEAIPAEFTDMRRIVQRKIRRRIYRPRVEDAAPVDVDGLVYEHTFSYLQADLDALREKKGKIGEDNAKDKSSD